MKALKIYRKPYKTKLVNKFNNMFLNVTTMFLVECNDQAWYVVTMVLQIIFVINYKFSGKLRGSIQ